MRDYGILTPLVTLGELTVGILSLPFRHLWCFCFGHNVDVEYILDLLEDTLTTGYVESCLTCYRWECYNRLGKKVASGHS